MVEYTQPEGPLPGKSLKVKFDGTFVDGVNEWKIDPKTDKKEITCGKATGSAQWKKYMATLKDATVTINVTEKDLSDPGQKKLMDNLLLDGGVKEIQLYEDDDHWCFCDAFVEAFPIGAKIDDVQGAGTTITLQVSDDDGIQFPTVAP
jgi:hypothetical protein